MPISPTPPSGAKTSSSCGEIIGAMVHRDRARSSGFLAHGKDFAGGDDLAPPVGEPQDEAPGLVERLEHAGYLAVGEPRPHRLAETGGPGQPGAGGGQAPRLAGKPAPRCHSASRAAMVRRSVSNNAGAAIGAPCTAKSVAGCSTASGWWRQLTPMPITAPTPGR